MNNLKKGVISLILVIALGITQIPLVSAKTSVTSDKGSSGITLEETTQQTGETTGEYFEHISTEDSTQDSEQIYVEDSIQDSEQMYAENSIKHLEGLSYLKDYTDMFGWERTQRLQPLIADQQQASVFSIGASVLQLQKSAIQPTTAQYLAILVEFPDVTDVSLNDEYTLKAMDMVFNSGGTQVVDNREIPITSLRDYTNQYSYGSYQVNASIFPRDSSTDKVVSHTASHPYGYYLQKTATNPIGYDSRSSMNYRRKELIEETLQAAATSIEAKFSGDQLDINGDGYIDCVTIIVESRGDISSNKDIDWANGLLWPHQAKRTFDTTIAGKKVGSYNLINAYDPKNQNTTFAHNGATITSVNQLKLNKAAYSVIHHEFLHMLGLPDLYRSHAIGLPVSFYDIMAANNPYSPQSMLRILSSYHLRWSATMPRIESCGEITIHRPKYQDRNEVTAYKIISPLNMWEYFVVEFSPKQFPFLDYMDQIEDGFIVYRVNIRNNKELINKDPGDGTKDYLYVFRPDENALGSGLGVITNAVLQPTVGTTYGKTLNEVAYNAGWDKNTLYFSDGMNSGIKLQVTKVEKTGSTVDSITLNVIGPAAEIQIDQPMVLQVGASQDLHATLLPANNTDTATNYEWYSSDESVIKMDVDTGRMTGVGAGTATVGVTITLQDGRTILKKINNVTVIAEQHSVACQGHHLLAVNRVLACVNSSNHLHVCENNFPDQNFRAYVKSLSGGDEYLTPDELKEIREISVASRNIGSLKGVEYLANLNTLYCSDNNLTYLDVRHNKGLEKLYCHSNALATLDISENTALTTLNCSSNQLTELNVSKNPTLTSLVCASNQLTTLDISKNPALTDLDCSYNQLTNLDAYQNPGLVYLMCYNNQLTGLDVSRNQSLLSLNCNFNQLTELDVSDNIALIALECHDNQLKSLDVSCNPVLKTLYCNYNQLTELDLSKNQALTALSCRSNQLLSLNVSKNQALTDLSCEYNQLTELDVSHNTALKTLYCYENRLMTLKLSGLQSLSNTDISNQSRTLSATHRNDNWVFDLSTYMTKDDLQRITLLQSETKYTYDSSTGIIQFNGTGEPKGFMYGYDTGNNTTLYIKVNTDGTGYLGYDANFTREEVSLSKALYTFTATGNGGYMVSGTTDGGQTVYLGLRPDQAGYPQTTDGSGTITLEPSSDSTFYIKSSDSAYTGYLYFWRNGTNYFDQQFSTTDDCKFMLYRPAARGETSSTKVPGYVQVDSALNINSGDQYLIVAETGGTFYALYPSNGTNNKYAHVVKINPVVFMESGTGHLGTDANFIGLEVPLSSALYTFTSNGSGSYTVSGTTNTDQTVYLRLRPGQAGYSQTTDDRGAITLEHNTDGSFNMKSTATDYTGYLYFWRDGKNYFDQQTTIGDDCKFLLYRRCIVGEISSSEVPGYVGVSSANDITNGGEYLIVAEVEDRYYALYPSSSTNYKYAHVVKINNAYKQNQNTFANSGTGNLGTDANFTGEKVSLIRAMYTFTSNGNGGYTVSSQTSEGQTVYLKLRPGQAGYSQTTDDRGAITLEHNTDGSFNMKSTATDYTGYLYFWRDGKNYFDQQTTIDDDCNFLLYRRCIVGETSSSEVPGYVQVYDLSNHIIDGNQYLIVARVDNSFYALYPSTSTNNKYAHVIRINPKPAESGTGNLGTDASFTGEEVSMRNALYTFTSNNGGYTVSAQTSSGETVNLCLRDGNTGYPQTTDNAGTISVIENSDGSFYIKSTSNDYTGYLDFWHTNGKLYFDQSVELKDVYSKRFYLYRWAAFGEKSSAEIPGYIQVTSADAITNGGKYLIVTEVEGCCYALYPSKTTDNKYSHVIKAKPAALPSATGNLGNDSSFTGQTVPLSSSLYTFTSNNGGYTVSAQTNRGETVNLCLREDNVGYPQTTDSSGTITLTQNNDGTFFIKSSSSDYTGYLYFCRDFNELYFDQSMNLDNPINNKFFLLRPAMEGERGRTEVPGYVLVNSASEIINGGQYLIVTEVHSTYYALHPSNDTSNRYSHVIKINPPELLESGTGNLGTDNTFTGETVSLHNALYDLVSGNDGCTISSKMSSGERVNLCLRPGKATYPQATDCTANIRLYVLEQKSSFMINSYTSQYNGFLYFMRDSGKLYFDQITQYDNDVHSTFFLYRPALANEKSSTEIPGYVRIIDYNNICSGEQFLIVHEVNGTYYGLYPSNSTNNPYNHVIKTNSYRKNT